MDSTTEIVNAAVQWFRLGIEMVGVAIVVCGVLAALFTLLRALASSRDADFVAVRLLPGRFLTLGLEFQLAADILSTAIAPNWEEIGKLAAIAVIRTLLNFFLMQEMKAERSQENTD